MLPKEMMNMTPDMLAFVYIMAFGIFLVSVLVALDARDSGLSKTACVMWSFAVALFPPIALGYLLSKKVIAQLKAAQAEMMEPQTEPSAAPVAIETKCPYCGVSCGANPKICYSCGRLI